MATAGTLAGYKGALDASAVPFFSERGQNIVTTFDPVFAERLQAAVLAAEQATGERANIVSGVRSTAQQAEIYARSHQGRDFPAAPPGRSMHEVGMAADFAQGKVRDWIQAHATNFGLEPAVAKRGWGYDAPHIQLARSVASTPYDTLAPKGGVTALQTMLAKAGFNPGPIDGVNGKQTKEAVMAFQAANGLRADGIVGPMTMTALQGPPEVPGQAPALFAGLAPDAYKQLTTTPATQTAFAAPPIEPPAVAAVNAQATGQPITQASLQPDLPGIPQGMPYTSPSAPQITVPSGMYGAERIVSAAMTGNPETFKAAIDTVIKDAMKASAMEEFKAGNTPLPNKDKIGANLEAYFGTIDKQGVWRDGILQTKGADAFREVARIFGGNPQMAAAVPDMAKPFIQAALEHVPAAPTPQAAAQGIPNLPGIPQGMPYTSIPDLPGIPQGMPYTSVPDLPGIPQGMPYSSPPQGGAIFNPADVPRGITPEDLTAIEPQLRTAFSQPSGPESGWYERPGISNAERYPLTYDPGPSVPYTGPVTNNGANYPLTFEPSNVPPSLSPAEIGQIAGKFSQPSGPESGWYERPSHVSDAERYPNIYSPRSEPSVALPNAADVERTFRSNGMFPATGNSAVYDRTGRDIPNAAPVAPTEIYKTATAPAAVYAPPSSASAPRYANSGLAPDAFKALTGGAMPTLQSLLAAPAATPVAASKSTARAAAPATAGFRAPTPAARPLEITVSKPRSTQQPSMGMLPSSNRGGNYAQSPAAQSNGMYPSWAQGAMSVPGAAFNAASFNPISGGSNFDYVVSPGQTTYGVPGGGSWTIDTRSGGGPNGDGTGTGSYNKVLCTFFCRKGWLPKAVWKADIRYSITMVDPMVQAGYLSWAAPLVRWLDRGTVAGNFVAAAIFPIVKGWAYEMAHRAEPIQFPASSVVGRIVMATCAPLCRVIGHCAAIARPLRGHNRPRAISN